MGKNYFLNEPMPGREHPAVLVAGHSWAEGTFKGHEAEVGKSLGMDVATMIKVGSGIDYAKSKIGDSPGGYRCALLFTGINDYWRPIGEIKKKFSDMVDTALAKTTGKVYVVNVPYYDEAGKGKIDSINSHIREMAAKNPRVVCIDLNSELSGKNEKGGKKHPEYSSAALHPGNYNEIRKFLVSEIGRNENAHLTINRNIRAF